MRAGGGVAPPCRAVPHRARGGLRLSGGGQGPAGPPPLRMVIEVGLRGAFLLARGRADGLLLIETSMAGLARSFWAAAICLPAFLALRLLAWAETGGPPAGLGIALAAELIGFACA